MLAQMLSSFIYTWAKKKKILSPGLSWSHSAPPESPQDHGKNDCDACCWRPGCFWSLWYLQFGQFIKRHIFEFNSEDVSFSYILSFVILLASEWIQLMSGIVKVQCWVDHPQRNGGMWESRKDPAPEELTWSKVSLGPPGSLVLGSKNTAIGSWCGKGSCILYFILCLGSFR